MIDAKIIINVLIAILLYNVILKAISATFIKQIMKTDVAKKGKKTFKDKLREKLNEDEST